MDRISTVPDDLIDQVLEKLPLIDRVRASILSRRWRLRWSYLPSLIMDMDRDFDPSITTKHNIDLDELRSSCIKCISTFSLVNLRRLEIRGRARAHDISHFVSLCPLLEEVMLNDAVFDQDIDLKAPKLRRLQLEGLFRDVFVSSAQNLESISWNLRHYDEKADLRKDRFQFFKSSKGLKHLSLDGRTSYLHMSRCSFMFRLPRFDQMNKLEFGVSGVMNSSALACLVKFCARSPNIRELTVKQSKKCKNCRVVLAGFGLRVLQSFIEDDFGLLVNVHLIGFYGSETEMAMIELLLSLSPVLELIYISFVDADEKPRLCEAITKLYRASPKVEFQFADDHRYNVCADRHQ